MLPRAGRTKPLPLVHPADLIPDGRLASAELDRLDNSAIAHTVADLALSVTPPANIALFGPWGSGKSSIYAMLRDRIEALGAPARVVHYDAWKFGGRDLKRNFIVSVGEQLVGANDARRLVEPKTETKIEVGTWLKENWGSLLGLATIAVCLTGAWVLAVGTTVRLLSDVQFGTAIASQLGSAGTILGTGLLAVFLGPKILDGAVRTSVTPAPSGDDEFSTQFGKLLKKAGIDGRQRLIVFVDELDRCAPEDVVATLIDLKTFLEAKGCVFVVAVDRAVVEEALREVPQAKPVRGGAPYYSTRGAFLDKIFQHQISLPPLRTRTLTLFAKELVDAQDGLWKQLREASQALYDLVIFALVPVHVQSPRRVKVLLNAFATNVRAAEARGIDWRNRAPELAALTVLQTEFPEVATDLVRVPRLLEYLRGTSKSDDAEVVRVVEKHFPPGTAPVGDEPPTGALLTESAQASDSKDNNELRVAHETIRRHLKDYLGKIASAGVTDPRRDLLYLQAAGQREGLEDPRLNEIIDSATDRAPDDVVAKFDGQPASVLKTAVELLVAEGATSFGPARYFVFESACKLVERLEWDDVEAIASTVAPRLLPSDGDPGWPEPAIPGALRIAAAAHNFRAARSLAARLVTNEDDGVLTRAAAVLPFLDPKASARLQSLLGEAYQHRPEPLHLTLSALPPSSALALWQAVQESVTEALLALEHPVPAESEPPTRRPGASRAVQAPPPTGNGRERLRELVNSTLSREDGEQLLSAVFETLQGVEDPAIQDEVTTLAEVVIPAISTAELANRHVLSGIIKSTPGLWPNWVRHLRSQSEIAPDSGLAQSAAIAVLQRISSADESELDLVVPTLRAVASLLSNPAPDLGNELQSLMAEYQWVDPADQSSAWVKRRSTTLDALEALREVVGTDRADTIQADDVIAPVEAGLLTNSTVSVFLARVDRLPSSAAAALVQRLETWKPSEDALPAWTQLRLRARVRAGEGPIDVSALASLGDSVDPFSAMTDWLLLQPNGRDVAVLAPTLKGNAAALEQWAHGSTAEDRTAAWTALASAGAPNATLSVVGERGVTGAVLDHVAEAIAGAPRQEDRDAAVKRLETTQLRTPAEPSEARRASELALRLLETRVAGNVRLAKRVIEWAGGPGRGYTAALRDLFGDGSNRKALSKSDLEDLEDLGLVRRRRPKFGKKRAGD